MSSILNPQRVITFVSDHNTGLVEALLMVIPSSFHGYCRQHLQTNLRNHLSGLSNGFWEKICSVDVLTHQLRRYFIHYLDAFKNEGRNRVVTFLKDLPFWALECCPFSWAVVRGDVFKCRRVFQQLDNQSMSFTDY